MAVEALAKGFDTPSTVIERLLDEHHPFVSGKARPVREPRDRPEVVFHPSDDEAFKAQLVEKGRAYVVLHKSDGTSESLIWNAGRFTAMSSLRGNLWSGYLRGWAKRGIVKAELAIRERDLQRGGEE